MAVNFRLNNRVLGVMKRLFDGSGSKDVKFFNLQQFKSVNKFVDKTMSRLEDVCEDVAMEYGYCGNFQIYFWFYEFAAWYNRGLSGVESVSIGIDTQYILELLWGRREGNVRRLIEHEYRHHLDRDFEIIPYVDDSLTWEESYIFDYLAYCRREGYADFCADKNVEDLKIKSALSRITVNKVVNAAIDEIFYQRDYKKFFPQTYLSDSDSPFCPYVQGPLLMDAIAMNKYGERMKRGQVLEFLEDIKSLNLHEFYFAYFKAARELDFSGREYVVPKQKTLSLLSKL